MRVAKTRELEILLKLQPSAAVAVEDVGMADRYVVIGTELDLGGEHIERGVAALHASQKDLLPQLVGLVNLPHGCGERIVEKDVAVDLFFRRRGSLRSGLDAHHEPGQVSDLVAELLQTGLVRAGALRRAARRLPVVLFKEMTTGDKTPGVDVFGLQSSTAQSPQPTGTVSTRPSDQPETADGWDRLHHIESHLKPPRPDLDIVADPRDVLAGRKMKRVVEVTMRSSSIEAVEAEA